MPKFFFFTDPDKLDSQTVEQAFGPVMDTSTFPGFDAYQITDVHTGIGAPVIAVCDGTVCIQEDTQGNLSIVLKPDSQPPFDFPYIDFFIYKGVDRASLLNGSAVLDETNANANELTKRVAREWKAQNNDNLSNSSSALGLDRDPNFDYDNDGNLIKVFKNTDPIRHLIEFQDDNHPIQLARVNAGEKIGTFKGEFGFEIILKHLYYSPSLELIREPVAYLKVAQIANPLDESNPTNYDYFLHWHQKEAVLSFVDPCAFWSSFYTNKLIVHTTLGKEKLKEEEIYNRLLVKFYNRNIVWLDIRNDFGFSLNYFKNYGYDIQLRESIDSTNASTITTNQLLWPIAQLKRVDILGQENDNLLHTLLELPKGDNENPRILYERAFVKKIHKLKRKDSVYKVDVPPISDFTEGVPLSFITVEGNNQLDLLSNYYKINFYDTRTVDEGLTNQLKLNRSHYLNGVFCLSALNLGINFSKSRFRYKIYHQGVLVNLSKKAGPIYSANVCLAEDNDNITLFAFPEHFILGNKFSEYLPDAFTSWADAAKQKDQLFIEEIIDVFKPEELLKTTLSVEEIPGVIEQIDTVIIKEHSFGFVDRFRQNESPEDYIFIILKKIDFEQIDQHLSDPAQFNQVLPRFITIDAYTHKTDENGVDYMELELALTGYKNNSGALAMKTISTSKKIYEYANF